jgi:hypothetical protein
MIGFTFLRLSMGLLKVLLLNLIVVVDNKITYRKESRTVNSRFAKAGGSCFNESEVLNPSFVHQMKFGDKNLRPSQICKPLLIALPPNKRFMLTGLHFYA